jgi:acyl-CoA reductase-like NAD-dependent aldehyde dehydrogenase
VAPRTSTPPSPPRKAALDGDWGALTAAERGRLLARLGTLVTEHAEALAEMEATDVGKPLTQARADVTRSPATASSTPAPPTRSWARRSPSSRASPSTRCANPSA